MKTYLLICLFTLCAFSPIFSISSQEYSPTPNSADSSFMNERAEPSSPPATNNEWRDPLLEVEHAPQETDDFQSKFFNMLFLLGLLIAFMLFASWALKRMMKTRVNQLNDTSAIKVIETRPLSPRANIHLIEISGQRLVVAESHTGVTHLATLPGDESFLESYQPSEED